jgi:hypothetical protein
VLLTALALLAYLGRALWAPGVHSPITDPDDFRAFYCGGQATVRLADPYLTEPLRGCENAAARVFGFAFPPHTVLPAPLPPYALALFALLGALPFPVASTIWFFSLLIALGITVLATTRLSGAAPGIVAVAFTLAGGLVSINEGQIVPLVTAALCVAAVALRDARWTAAAAALGIAVCEPHVAITAFASALREKAMRRPIAMTAVVLAVVALVAGGPARAFEYFARVLPAHAHSEVSYVGNQFSLTTTAWSFGATPDTSLALGTIDYLAMFALGVVVAIRLRERFDDRAFLVLGPPAFVLLGGTFIHLSQMEIAVPLAFLAYAKMMQRRVLLGFAIVGLAVPTQFLIVASPLRHTFYPSVPAAHRAYVAAPGDAAALAETTEMGSEPVLRPAFVSALVATLPKLPTWLALAALVSACVAEAFARGVRTVARPRAPAVPPGVGKGLRPSSRS